MKCDLRLMVFFLLPYFAFASVDASAPVDIIERTINFVIFCALLYYFAGDKIKNIFITRRNDIANSLAKIQERLQESQREKQKALKSLEESKKKAQEIIKNAENEAKVLVKKIDEQTQFEIENLIRQYNETINLERKKVEKRVVNEILDELLNKESTLFSSSVLNNILLRKVAS